MKKVYLKNKKNMNMLIVIFVIIILLSSALLFVAITIFGEKEKIEESLEPTVPLTQLLTKTHAQMKNEGLIEEIEIVDDRISPSVNQAIFFEIHRIRKKGITDVVLHSGSKIFKNFQYTNELIQTTNLDNYNKILVRAGMEGLRPGFGWDKKPSYFFMLTLNDYEEKARFTYNDWDTGYANQVMFRNVEEEQSESPVIFKIIENVEVKKLLRKTVVETEMESFELTYCFRTGRWTGDDYFNDSDGYGHYNGENYEVWFSITQTSEDGDIIPYWAEINILGTDPLKDDTFLDPDGDGIPTVWEWKWGYNPFVYDNHSELDPDKDGLQNNEEYKMEKWLANPYYQDIYIEVDYMQQTPGGRFRFELVREKGKLLPRIKKSPMDGWKHEFYYESQQMLIDIFNKHSMSVHIDDGRMGGGGDILPFTSERDAYGQDSGYFAGFYKNNFADERKGIFRYAVIAYSGGWCHPQDQNHFYDMMVIPHNFQAFKNNQAFALTERTKRIGQAIQVLHELGHSLGLVEFEGIDNTKYRAEDQSTYPYLDYVSVMNYDYFVLRYFDYSHGLNGEYDQNDWEVLDLTFFPATC
jgi:hypothetical protein